MLKASVNELPRDYRFNGIDLMKFVCAYLICMTHVRPFPDTPAFREVNFLLQNSIFRFAVPFYFVTSGFLLFRKIDLKHWDNGRIKTYCFRLLRLFGTWFILTKIGGSGFLWYLTATAVAVLLLSVPIRRGVDLRLLFCGCVVLYLIGTLGTSYYGVLEPIRQYTLPNMLLTGYEKVFKTTCNGVFFAPVFVMIGVFFAQKKIVMPNAAAVAGLIVSLALVLFEAHFLEYYGIPADYNMYLSLVPTAFFLFYLVSHLQLRDRPIYPRLRVIGLLLYFTHLTVDGLLYNLMEGIQMITGMDLFALEGILTICFTTVLAVLLEWLSKREHFRWLRYLYS